MSSDINEVNRLGETALMIAAPRGNIEEVRRLLEAGADPCRRDRDGMTARVRAHNRGHDEIVALLLAAEESAGCGKRGEGQSREKIERETVIATSTKHQDEDENSSTAFPSSSTSGQLDRTPVLPILFYILASLSLLGGILLSSEFWPGDPGYGREWKTEAYTLSIIWFTVGLVEAALYAAIGQGLSYLHKIVKNTSK